MAGVDERRAAWDMFAGSALTGIMSQDCDHNHFDDPTDPAANLADQLLAKRDERFPSLPIEQKIDFEKLEQKELLRLCTVLVDLNKSPHPGLFTWNDACVRAVTALTELFAKVRT